MFRSRFFAARFWLARFFRGASVQADAGRILSVPASTREHTLTATTRVFTLTASSTET